MFVEMFLLLYPWFFFIFFLFRFYFLRFFYFSFQKPREPRPIEPYQSSALFSVDFYDCVIASSSMVLSAMRTPLRWCHPQVQYQHKRRRRQAPTTFKLMLLSLLALQTVPTVFSLPGTNHVLIRGESSNNTSRQQAYAQTIINNKIAYHAPVDDSEATSNTAADAPQDELLRQQPHCFIADTNSVPYVLDSGANRVILNDAKLFKDFQAKAGNIKGIGGSPVSLNGIGNTNLSLKSDDGSMDLINLKNAVYVPTSPFNLIPPQLLIAELKRADYNVDYAKHDELNYIFTYKSKSSPAEAPSRNLTVPIGDNKLFTMRSNDGYKSFFKQATSNYVPEWCMFAGAGDVIPEDDLPRESQDEGNQFQRESTPTNQPRTSDFSQPDAIPYKATDFEPVNGKAYRDRIRNRRASCS
jgi:hypothetical protein